MKKQKSTKNVKKQKFYLDNLINFNSLKKQKDKPNIFVIGLFLVVGWLVLWSVFGTNTTEEVPFSKIIDQIKQEKVEKVEFNDNKIIAYPKDGSNSLEAQLPVNTDFLKYLQDSKLDSKVNTLEAKTNIDLINAVSVIFNVLLFVLFALFLFMLFKGRGGGGPGDIFNFGKSRAKLFIKNSKKNTTFKDVSVEDEIREEMYEIVDFLKSSEKYKKVGARIPKGVLLVGPAGVGKTLIARAIAGEAGVPFYSAAGSEFMEMLVGVGSARVRDLFKNAKLNSPALIFIDEIDAIGRQRGMGIGGGHDEREQTLNQILVEMDGFEANTNVIVIAATNRPDMLDPALVRPGRFDRKITLNLPTVENREKIIEIHAKGKPFEKGVDFNQVAKRTVGFSGADIENMLNEAAILAARENRLQISKKDINEAATKVKLGPERKKLQDENDKKITAYHEAGHAIVAHYLKNVEPVRRISIVARTYSLGHTDITSDKEDYNFTKERILQRIAMIFGGRVTEEMFFNEQSTGASNDIEKASGLARSMVTEWGMSSLGPINYTMDTDKIWLAKQMGSDIEFSEKIKEKIDIEVEKIIAQAVKMAKDIITKNKSKLIEVAEELIKVETMEQEDFEKIVGEKPKK